MKAGRSRNIFGEVAEEQSDERSDVNEKWFVYILECRTKDLYVGIAKDVDKRIKLHNKGLACRYTKFRKPVVLLYIEECDNYNHARKRESEVKKFSRAKKITLVENSKTSHPTGVRGPQAFPD